MSDNTYMIYLSDGSWDTCEAASIFPERSGALSLYGYDDGPKALGIYLIRIYAPGEWTLVYCLEEGHEAVEENS